MQKINILFVTKLRNSMACGVTVAVTQLLNAICNYARVGWLDLNNVDINLDPRIERLTLGNWDDFPADISVFEDPFNSVEFCRIASKLRKRGVPYILSPHGCFTKEALRNKALKKNIAINTIFRAFLQGCVGTQFLCENEQLNSMIYNMPLIVPNGVPQNENYAVKKKIKRVLFLGRKDVRHKGLDYLLEAVNFKREFLASNNVAINIYGSFETQNDEGFINEYIENNNLQGIVKNYGPVFGKDKEKILTESDLFILTSRYEGFPMSILEAMSYALPVVITEGTNLCGIVSEANAGWTCKNSVQEIGEALENAIKASNIETISRNAKELSLKYSWNAIAKMTIDIYDGIIERQIRDELR